MSAVPDFEFRRPSKSELAIIVRAFRAMKGWTQETLAELAGVASRTIQRLEDGQGAGADTLRAIARAIDADDLDLLLKPQSIPTEAGLQRRKEAFEREHLMLNVTPAPTGRAVEAFMSTLNMLCCDDQAVEDQESRENAAALFDYLRDYLDFKSDASHQDRLAVEEGLQDLVTALREAGWTPVVATRRTQLMNDHWIDKTPWPVTIGYLTLVPKGREPLQIAVQRGISLA
jgi:transcriptional regulator with XRE-family HTH domain